MPNKIPRLLAPAELLDIYGIPVLRDTELEEYFTFNEEEIKALRPSNPKTPTFPIMYKISSQHLWCCIFSC